MKVVRELKINGVTEWSALKIRLKNYLKTGNSNLVSETESGKDLSIGIIAMIDDFLKGKAAEYKPETARKYRVLQVVIQDFENHIKRAICLSDLSYLLMENFRLYLLNVRQNRNDTIYKMLAALKCVIRWLIDSNYAIAPNCLKLRQSTKTKHDIVTLDETELQKLEAANLNPFQTPIRDCFLFQVYTGQRFSDMQQLKPEQVNDKTWQFQSVKTGKSMYIPLVGWSNKAFEIACRYQFDFPQYTQQYFNREVTKICRQAGITTSVTLNRYVGSKTIQITKPKCDLVSSHTARRTCVSLLLEKGVPPTVVMRLTRYHFKICRTMTGNA